MGKERPVMSYQTQTKQKPLEFWSARKKYFELRPVIKFYNWLISLPQAERQEVINKYNNHLEETKLSEAYQIYKNKNYLLAREKLTDEDYQKPPFEYDPVYVLHVNQEVRDYQLVLEHINDFELENLSENVYTNLL